MINSKTYFTADSLQVFAIFQIVTLNSLDAKMGWCYLLPHELQGFIGSESDKRAPTEIQFKQILRK